MNKIILGIDENDPCFSEKKVTYDHIDNIIEFWVYNGGKVAYRLDLDNSWNHNFEQVCFHLSSKNWFSKFAQNFVNPWLSAEKKKPNLTRKTPVDKIESFLINLDEIPFFNSL